MATLMRYLPPDAPEGSLATQLRTPTVLMGHGNAVLDAPPQIPISVTTLIHEIRPWFRGRMQRGNALVPGSNDQWAASDLAG